MRAKAKTAEVVIARVKQRHRSRDAGMRIFDGNDGAWRAARKHQQAVSRAIDLALKRAGIPVQTTMTDEEREQDRREEMLELTYLSAWRPRR